MKRERVIVCHRVQFKVKEITERNYVSLESITKPSLQTTLLRVCYTELWAWPAGRVKTVINQKHGSLYCEHKPD